jgi:hypothetical protein
VYVTTKGFSEFVLKTIIFLSRRNTNPAGATPSVDLPRRASLSELDEENLGQVDQEAGNRLASSTVA